MDKAKCYFCESEIEEEDIFIGMPLVSINYRHELSGRILPMCYRCADKLKRFMIPGNKLKNLVQHQKDIDKLSEKLKRYAKEESERRWCDAGFTGNYNTDFLGLYPGGSGVESMED